MENRWESSAKFEICFAFAISFSVDRFKLLHRFASLGLFTYVYLTVWLRTWAELFINMRCDLIPRKKSLTNKFKLCFVWLFCHVGLQCSVETPHKIYCHSTFMRQHAYECDHWSLAHIIIPRRRLTHIFVKHWTNVSTNVCAIFMKK